MQQHAYDAEVWPSSFISRPRYYSKNKYILWLKDIKVQEEIRITDGEPSKAPKLIKFVCFLI